MTPVFVFGSNLAGRHGAGAAKFAVENRGAIYGQGIGYQGNSYGIPTKDQNIETLPLDTIESYVDVFLSFAKNHPEMTFQLTPIGCGLAGYKPTDIAHMFSSASGNVLLPDEFKEVLRKVEYHYEDFEEWFFEGEEYAMRSERFYDSLKATRSELGQEANVLVWLKAAFEAGRKLK